MTDALSAALFHFLWQGALLALVPALALMFPSPRVRYAAACVALFAMPAVFAITFAISIPQPFTNVPPVTELHPFAPVSASGAHAWTQPFNFAQSMRWFVPFWLIGVALFYLRTLGSWLAVQRLRRNSSTPAPAIWRRRLDELAARLGIRRAIALLGSELVDVPVVAGILRPAIFVPAALFTGMPAEQLEYLLIHELAHIRRFDYAVNLFQKAVEGLLFYHPAVWWVSRILRTERENCCDDAVVAIRGNARTYARILASLEQSRTAQALAASGGNLAKRVLRLLNRPQNFSAAPLLGLTAIAISATVAWAALQEQPLTLPPIQSPRAPAAPAIHRYAYAQAARPAASPATPDDFRRSLNQRVADIVEVELRAALIEQAPPQPADQPKKADVPAAYRRWMNEDVVYIIQKDEREAFQKLTTDAERDRFIEQFWKRRDPTPGTPANEFKEEHYRRIAFANLHFKGASLEGWKSDRGRIYITYGPPDEIDSHSSGGNGDSTPWETWKYRLIESVGQNVVIEFRGVDYRMTSDPHALPK